MWLARRMRWRGMFILICLSFVFYVWPMQSLNHHHGTVMEDRGNIWQVLKQNLDNKLRHGSSANFSSPETDDFIMKFLDNDKVDSIYRTVIAESYGDFLYRLNSRRQKGVFLEPGNRRKPRNSLEMFYKGINENFLYDLRDYDVIEQLLLDISSFQVVSAGIKVGGTQIKFLLSFKNGLLGLFKPMSCSRETETPPDIIYYQDRERHNAEIAAFHVDKVLGFNKAMPTVGRGLNITTEIMNVLQQGTQITFYTSEAGNSCMLTQCKQHCGAAEPVCARADVLEGSIAAYLPPRQTHARSSKAHPWIRSYSVFDKDVWQDNDTYCDTYVKQIYPFNNTNVLLNIIDMAVLDFFIGNMDRHHFEQFEELGTNSFILHFDHGRGFGKSRQDCMSCLAPLQQCCMIRLSTFAKLIKLYQGPNSMSQVVRESMASDPVSPVLWEPHLDALDRRVEKIIKTVKDCVNSGRPWDSVFVDDLTST